MEGNAMTAQNWMGSFFHLTRSSEGFRLRLDMLLTWIERSAQRRALARLDYRMMTDLGLNRAQVEAEAAKPFWKE
ncbi:hypothetical protein A6A05_03310 [Magnetospirillum moscoviense]|uniref:YjiS-like domain-containing protein n=2 Tax=Magnetospirillum moscoviense TaxID=1437059 RepID=A0A178MI65_9PROT|nr:hypothetical protein A6A05_03310 [Magnetospirillum moscoviense]